ncbi:MAG: hypothetical protein HY721_18655, partial [Planctomycetes bacterium]|nr:hypothetical protein [Planctomycetota bacterium]
PARAVSVLAVGLLLAVPGCLHLDRAEPARPPRGLPQEWVRPYRPPTPGLGLSIEPAGLEGRYWRSHVFRFFAFSEREGDFRTVEGRLYQATRVPPGVRTPLLLISPILAGAADDYLACRVFARWACREGISAFYVHQEEDILAPERDGVELERLLRENIQDSLRALDLLRDLPGIDPGRLGSLGISMGALKNVVLAAVEPRLQANVLCLGGADLAGILGSSRERRVLLYLRDRGAREGLTRDEISSDIAASLLAEPTRFAPAVASERVLLFLGRLDNKVPYPSGEFLRRLLGKPETYLLLLGHYTGMVAAPFAAREMFRFLKERWEAGGGPGARRPADA